MSSFVHSLSCHAEEPRRKRGARHSFKKFIRVALVGNVNVGKSVIFNHLVGWRQIVGNWPGKTVERAEGTVRFRGYDISVIDLPGIYSFSTHSQEELITREYIATEKPDVMINVVDASVLERNLFFTIQLIEMEEPIVLCLNQVDVARRKGITFDYKKLADILGIQVIQTVATRGVGIDRLMDAAIDVVGGKLEPKRPKIRYGDEIEERIEKLTMLIQSKDLKLPYSPRWIALKLLEDDEEVKKIVRPISNDLILAAGSLSDEIERIHKEPCFMVIASERYALVGMIVGEVQQQIMKKESFAEKLDMVTMHRVFGYLMGLFVITGLLLWTFILGNFLSSQLSNAFSLIEKLEPRIGGSILSILWNGVFGGFVAGVTLVIPYVLPFYFLLAIIEDSGYLTRLAFMMDSFMHKIGLHGKALIPLVLGYGCNVPAIFSCRILETRGERLLAAFVITLVPCAARGVVILGLVGAFVGIEWALILYILDILIIFSLGRIAFKSLPYRQTGLIMEMHPYKLPLLSVVAKQTWFRTKSLIYLVFPIYILGSAVIQLLFSVGVLEPISEAASILTVTWLGLPAITVTLLIFGIIRKEMTVLMLTAIFGTTNFALVLTPIQMIVLALIAMLYIPCLATITALAKEFGWKPAILVTVAEVSFAILLGGLAYRALMLLG